MRTARFAFVAAATNCSDECRAYHEVRPLLRALGLSAEPSDQESFFRQAIDHALRDGGADILICGSSDTAMPDLVGSVIAGRPARLTLLDLCATPLQLSIRHPPQGVTQLAYVQSDILQWQTAARYDVIVTHSFFGQFQPQKRASLIKKWRELLNPGGRVITVNRIRQINDATAFKPLIQNELADLVIERLSKFSASGFDGRVLRKKIAAYVAMRKTHPVGNVGDITSLFLTEGFNLEKAQLVRAAPRHNTLIGPAMPDGAEYLHLIAIKP